jgi:hypothetical protein
MSVIPIQVGYELRRTIQAYDGDITDSLDILIDTDKGMPVMAAISPTVVSGLNGGMTNVATRIFSMTPHTSQVGMRFEVCFRATNTNPDLPVLGPNVDAIRCIIIKVVEPELSWTNAMEDGTQLTPPEGSTFETYPGCYIEMPLYANSVWYKTVFGFETYVQEFDGTFTPTSSMPGAEVVSPHPRAVIPPSSFVNIANNYSHSGLFRYQPGVAMAGRRIRVCLTASDEWSLNSVARCVTVDTGSCKACLREGQSISGLAAEYKTDWVQVWAVNPRIGRPNAQRHPNILVNIGVLYTSRGGERLQTLAEKFYTSVDRILSDNPDFIDRSYPRHP